MDSRHSDGCAEPAPDAPAGLAHVRDAIRGGNWTRAESVARGLAQCAIPRQQDELGEYLDALKQTLILAKASRSNAAASLARVRAASRFQANCPFVAPVRQDFADSADIRHSGAGTAPLPSNT
jgi:hypothetical protein